MHINVRMRHVSAADVADAAKIAEIAGLAER
jgi:hypothetical protein